MSNENKSHHQGGLQILQLQLTKEQCQALSKYLPKGFSLEVQNKSKKDSSHKPSKKIVTNDGNVVKKVAPPKPVMEPTPNSTAESLTPSAKRTLREKKKGWTYLEDKLIDNIQPLPPTTSSKPVKSNAEATKKCFGLLQKLKKHNCAGPFLHPVDVEGLGLYDYYDIIPEPMDLSTVEKKLKAGEYSSVHEFGADIRKIWKNAITYNAEGSSIYNMTQRMSSYFERIFKEIEDVQFTDKVKDLEEKVKNLTKALTELTRPVAVIPAKPSRPGGGGTKAAPAVTLEKPMTIQEKKVLCDNIKKLPPESLRGVWEIVSKGLPNNQNNKEELVFDIDALPVRVTRELERYVKGKMAPVRSNKNKPKEVPAAKQAPAHDYTGYNMNAQQPAYNHVTHPNGQRPPGMPSFGNKTLLEMPGKDKDDDAESKSSDSSFISDSESGSDDERKHKAKPAQNYLVKQQDLASFQAGGHGSMLNSFIVK